MKNNLNEQLSRIKSMMKMVNENEFESNEGWTNIQDLGSRANKIDGQNLEFPYQVSQLFNKLGFEIFDRTKYAMGDRKYTLMFNNKIPSFGVSFEDGNLILKTTDYLPLKQNLKDAYSFDLSGDSMEFELGLLEHFLEKVIGILKDGDESSVENDDYDEKQERNYGVED